MAFKYSCFISYRRGKGELTLSFIEELKRALVSYLEPYFDLDIFIDDQELQAGDRLDKRLANALCQSVCMIQVFTPKYFSSQKLYCTREFMAMEILEQERFKVAAIPSDEQTFSFIIPIVFRGSDLIPSAIQKRGRLYYDFSKYTTVEPRIRYNALYVGHLDKIARRIYDLHETFSLYDNLHDCKKFGLPSEKDSREWLKKVKPSRPKPRFPGRRGGA